jgi:sensor histidine kinase YesM
LAKKWLAIIGEIEKMYNELDSLRLQYRLAKSNEKSQLGNRILQLEKKYEQALAEKHQLEKDIRTYEQR